MSIIHPAGTADNYRLLLKPLADALLSAEEDDDSLSGAVAELYSLCARITGIDDSSTNADDLGETGLPNGKAISPRDAARCVLDYRRTSKFLRGIQAAILEAQKRFPNTVIAILYAGCGPFAPLAIPLTSRFSSAEIQFTLLDIHTRSLDAARRVFQAFGLNGFVREYVQCDAASYKKEATQVIHIAVVEAMQAALEKEPQVAITMNLAPQLCPGGMFIPERIAVDCYLCDPTKDLTTSLVEADAANSLSAGSSGNKVMTKLGGVLELTAESCRNLLASGSGGEHRRTALFPEVILNVPEGIDGEFNLMLVTTITIFDYVALRGYESGLTSPRILFDLGKTRGGMRIAFACHPGDKPGFRYRSL